MEDELQLVLDNEHCMAADDLDPFPWLEAHGGSAGYQTADRTGGESNAGDGAFELPVGSAMAEGRDRCRRPHEPEHEVDEMDGAGFEDIDIAIAERELPREERGRRLQPALGHQCVRHRIGRRETLVRHAGDEHATTFGKGTKLARRG